MHLFRLFSSHPSLLTDVPHFRLVIISKLNFRTKSKIIIDLTVFKIFKELLAGQMFFFASAKELTIFLVLEKLFYLFIFSYNNAAHLFNSEIAAFPVVASSKLKQINFYQTFLNVIFC